MHARWVHAWKRAFTRPAFVTGLVNKKLIYENWVPGACFREERPSAQCVHWTVFPPLDQAQWDILSNLTTVILLNIYLSQRARSRGTLRKLDFRLKL